MTKLASTPQQQKQVALPPDLSKRICTKCGVEKPMTCEFFHPHKGCRGGFNSQCKACIRAGTKLRRHNNPGSRLGEHVIQYRKDRKAALLHYSNGALVCACANCTESLEEFLTIDHINGGGHRERKRINTNIYFWLRKQGYPEGYRVLCMNCNHALGLKGYCPHDQKGR